MTEMVKGSGASVRKPLMRDPAVHGNLKIASLPQSDVPRRRECGSFVWPIPARDLAEVDTKLAQVAVQPGYLAGLAGSRYGPVGLCYCAGCLSPEISGRTFFAISDGRLCDRRFQISMPSNGSI